MKKNKLNLKYLVPIIFLPTATINASLSCSNKQPEKPLTPDISIVFDDKVIYSRYIEIPIQINIKEVSQLTITLIDATDGVILVEPTIKLEGGAGFVKIKLNEEILSGTLVHFGINFRGAKEIAEEINITKNGFNFLYLDEHEEEEKDILYPQSTYDFQRDSHYFSYKVNISNVPTSQEVTLELFDDPNNNLKLLNTSAIVHKTPSEIFIEFNVQLDYKISQSRAIPFSMRFQFINSLGEPQVNEIHNYVANFVRSENKGTIIPVEFLNVSVDEAGVKTLHGLKNGVKSVDLMPYSEIEIPDGVENISGKLETEDHSFIWEKNIKKIKFCGKEKNIISSFFEPFISIYELDFSKYIENYPSWIRESGVKFTNIRQCGYVWASNNEFAKQIQVDLWEASELPQQWTAYNIDSVTDEDFFVISDDRVIEHISDVGKKKINNIKVIKFPHDIKGINADALTPLKRQPYINMSDPSHPIKETRRLMLDLELSNICSSPKAGLGVFSNIGVAGPILINCPHLRSFGDYEFYDLNHYDLTWLDDIVIENKTYIDIINLADINAFGRFSFALSNLFDFVGNTQPLSRVQNVGDFAFYCNKFTSLTLYSTTDIGEKSFADTYSAERDGTIESIDLSDYSEIINPEEVSEQKRTRMPEWWTKSSYVFKGSLSISSTAQKVCFLSEEIKKEVEYKNTQWGEEDPTAFPDLETWEKNFKECVGINEDWTISYV